MPTIVIPAGWRTASGIKPEELQCAAQTVGQAVDWLVETWPELRPRVLSDSGRLASWINVYVDEADIRGLDGLDTPASPNSEIMFLPAMAGG
ncbi:MoaD/ThiS family protein [Streptosporangium lutulentum]|uniref:Adenylyltransferase/sulfurtransferase n=1 Tax=Streptosporangium lutulentum TaxID=1461250 RepID=A0ABT9QA19_9ACTN|nr:MoaD/ThiS family protein [Streptosporangium lutulentum]MDP9843231.1 adenylyltransferase/sulfurtransferase [Streptosporangium lutulentum]